MEILDKQAFFETREKIFALNKNLNSIRQRVQIAETDRKKCLITVKELESLPQTTKTYKAVGKMFVVAPINTLKVELKQQAAKREEESTGYINQGKYIEAQLNEAQASLKELVKMK
ncbi:hypothetical protein DICPUDRAFT_42377 [Dictyostelium purpureum]|uniref:Prefoldin subunit 1 n=1 Tax=Dictyostelium purpureum TaxID=5786 RepID=F1A1X1_DICPU|nr:uncharacterized protein DICPUDRAFT_42377 [Dictyostelium purpureum]EGC29800.1 hypothetical protein DICPUDRAFT_42377 [Dictyostelium purpureum]|eukprot:XP_003293665.1 hypothetical protein DICPUDRAFT_42377 [Dictyostelium purpureum]